MLITLLIITLTTPVNETLVFYLGRKRKLRTSEYFFCSFNLHLNSILFQGYFWLAAPKKSLRFPRATLQLPQKKPTSSGIFSRCFSDVQDVLVSVLVTGRDRF